MVLPVSSCVVQLICFVYFYMLKNYILIFFFNISPMGTPKLNLKPKQHNSKILHSLAGPHFFEVTICRYRVHTVKRYVFLLSSPPTQIHRNTFLELAFKSPSSHLYLLQQTMLPVHPATREGTLSCCSWPSWTLSSSCTEEWLNRPTTSKWLELSKWGGKWSEWRTRCQCTAK